MTKGRRGENLKAGQPRPWIQRGDKHPQWKGDKACKNSKRGRARRTFKLGPCQDCGKPATDRHHEDGDTGNNSTDNVVILCRKCHMIRDGRSAALAKKRMPKRDPLPCANCGVPSSPLRGGLCHACNEYLRRTGRKRPYKEDGYRKAVEARNSGPCKRCLRPANLKGYPTRGYCASCYAYILRQEKVGLPVKPFRGH